MLEQWVHGHRNTQENGEEATKAEVILKHPDAIPCQPPQRALAPLVSRHKLSRKTLKLPS